MLNKRFKNDKTPIIKLNEIQLEAKKNIERKINSGTYKFEKINCILCNSNRFRTLAQKDRYGLEVPTVICLKCGLVQTNPRMDSRSYSQFYNSEYRKLYGGTNKINSEFFEDQIEKGTKILKFIETKTNKKIQEKFVVEIGTGAGGILFPFKNNGNEVLGLDYGSEYIKFGQKKGLNLKVGDINYLENIDRKIDIVIYCHVLEHLSNPLEELRKLKKHLHSDSIVYIEVPGLKNLFQSYEQNFLKYLQNAHTYHFSKNKIKEISEKAGFRLIYGNEKIESLIKVSSQNPPIIKNEYSEIVTYLKRLEKQRRKLINFYLIKTKIFKLLLNLLKKINLDKSAKKIYYNLLK
ncbi:MAG: class I SAM-dependent methyltransferase [Candidatus Woesearchaeota archaeon]